MIKAVLFDLDGVLVDSEVISRKASDKILADAGIFQTEQERKRVFGRRTLDNYRDAIEARGLDVDPQELVGKKNQLFKKLIIGELKPLPGVLDFIGLIKDNELKTAVVSSSPLERVNASLEEVGLLLEFDFIISGDCVSKGKPDPEPFLLAAEMLKVHPGGCIVVEDAQAGIDAGKAAGMRVIAVRSPNTHGQDLSKADVILDSLEDAGPSLLE
ncbi:HAD family hydrolase [Candidatus Altiarchaeota archaeon]